MKACAFLCVHSRLPDINQASAFSIGLRVWQGLNDEGLATPEVKLGVCCGALRNPFGSLIAMYIFVEDPVSGTIVKLPGEVTPDLITGPPSRPRGLVISDDIRR